jgi:hypothetical protein
MGLIDTDTGLQFGTGLVWLAGGIGQDGLVITSSTSGAALFLAEWGPYGMAMDFTDSSISIDDSTGVLDYNSQGTISSAGAPLGPGSKLTYTAPSAKLTEQADGYLGFQAHNYALRSDTPANWTPGGTVLTDTNLFTENGATSSHHVILPIGTTGITGATYVLTVEVKPEGGLQWVRIQGDGATGHLGTSSSFDLLNGVVGTRHASIAATSISTASADGYYTCTLQIVATGANVSPLISFATADGTGNESYAGNSTRAVRLRKWHLRRTPSVSTYVATTSAAVYDLPYVYSSGVKTGILVEPAATNLCLYSRDLTNAAWIKTSASAALTATGIDGIANSASTLTATSANGVAIQNISSASAARSVAISLKRRTGTGTVTISHGATTGSTLVTNGTFASDVTSWTSHNSGVVTFASGTLQVQESGNVNPAAYQAVTVTAGKMYKLTGTSAVTGGTGSARVSVYDTAPATTLIGTAATTSGAAATGSLVFRASDTQVSIVLIIVSASAGATATFDNIELLEVAETDVTSSINSGTWTRVSILNETITNPAVCIKLATSGDELDVDLGQCETGTVATSPIITYGAAVTRAVDTPYILTNLFPSSLLTFSVYANYVLPSPSFSFPCPFTVYQNSSPTTNRAQIYHGASGADYNSTFRVNSSLGGTVNSIPVGSAFAPLTSVKAMIAVQSGSNAACTNGGTVATNAAAVVFADLDRLSLSQAGVAQCNGLIKSIAYFPERKADATLQTMTTA